MHIFNRQNSRPFTSIRRNHQKSLFLFFQYIKRNNNRVSLDYCFLISYGIFLYKLNVNNLILHLMTPVKPNAKFSGFHYPTHGSALCFVAYFIKCHNALLLSCYITIVTWFFLRVFPNCSSFFGKK